MTELDQLRALYKAVGDAAASADAAYRSLKVHEEQNANLRAAYAAIREPQNEDTNPIAAEKTELLARLQEIGGNWLDLAMTLEEDGQPDKAQTLRVCAAQLSALVEGR